MGVAFGVKEGVRVAATLGVNTGVGITIAVNVEVAVGARVGYSVTTVMLISDWLVRKPSDTKIVKTCRPIDCGSTVNSTHK